MIRVGQGYDVHRLVADRPLVLGGVAIEHDKGLAGHSDADVLIHSLCDALLGAAGKGDIGQHFPDTDSSYRNIDSRILLRKVISLLKLDSWQLVNADLTVIAQAPKLAPHIAEELWQLLGNKNLLHETGMPTFKPEHLVRDTISYVIQINGKVRGKMDVLPGTTEDKIREMALEVENVKRTIDGKTILKVIVIPDKMVSIAIS